MVMVERQMEGGVEGVVPAGTTGEASTLEVTEQIEVIRTSVKAANGRIRVMAGVGSNCTKDAILLSKGAEEVGADSLLHVAPYYVGCGENGLLAHFGAIAESTKLPIVLYNIPGRCGKRSDITPAVVARLRADYENIVGIKEAGGDPRRVSLLRDALEGCPPFAIFCGDDSLVIDFESAGAVGLISVLSNWAPRHVRCAIWRNIGSNPIKARQALRLVSPMIELLFKEGNPVGIKTLMDLEGLHNPSVRLPLVQGSVSLREEMEEVLQTLYKAEILLT
jgi:4-hydroxy-tetrahydrodipicolinate synthase